jgi:transcriptional regulator with XRE-family HTH domain
MDETFGTRLRRLRMEADIGLRELARRIGSSPGYLSDVEGGRVPPPSEALIIGMASALGVPSAHLLAAAKKVDPDVASYVAEQPGAADFLRMARNRRYSADDWERLRQLAEISRLGSEEESQE